jgi:hypothetical protein
MRRLALALALIVAAIVGLVVLDHYSGRKRAVVAPAPPSEPPAITTLPAPEPIEPGSPAPQAPVAHTPPDLPPPPPPAGRRGAPHRAFGSPGDD